MKEAKELESVELSSHETHTVHTIVPLQFVKAHTTPTLKNTKEAKANPAEVDKVAELQVLSKFVCDGQTFAQGSYVSLELVSTTFAILGLLHGVENRLSQFSLLLKDLWSC